MTTSTRASRSSPLAPTRVPARRRRRRVDVDPRLPAPPPVPQAADRASGRARAWWGAHRADVGIAGLVLALAAAALISGLDRWPNVTDDEGTYVAQAWAVATRGTLSHYTYWYDHPPLGWLQLVVLEVFAAPVRLFAGEGATAVLDARRLVVVPALVSIGLVYVLARRLALPRAFAALAMAAFAFSPLSISMLRSVLLDGLALPWILAAFVLALSPKQRLWSFAASGTCAAIAVLSKETMLVLVPALAFTAWRACERRTRPFCFTAFAVPLALIIAGFPLFALLKGELFPGGDHVSLWEAVTFQLGRPSTGSPLDPRSGSHDIVAGWFDVDSVLLVAGFVALPFACAIRRLRPIGWALGSIVLVGLRPGYLPIAYVLAALPFAALALAGVLHVVWDRLQDWKGRTHAVAALTTALLVLVVGGIGLHWNEARASVQAVDANRSEVAATRWIAQNIDSESRILVDDTLFVDLVDAGFRPGLGVVWFYKLDTTTNLDPSVLRRLPGGAAEFDYVVSSPVLRSTLRANPGQLGEVRRALRESSVVATFGSGAQRVEVRAIEISGESRDAS